jgi:hypothetical protein
MKMGRKNRRRTMNCTTRKEEKVNGVRIKIRK